MENTLIPEKEKVVGPEKVQQKKPAKKSENEVIEGSAAIDVSIDDVLKALNSGYGIGANNEDKKKFAELLSRRLKQEAARFSCANSYNVVVIYDNTTLIKADSDKIYSALTTIDKTKPLLLVLLSRGGEPGSAYLIGKLCRETCNGRFVVAVPRYAKSAATLLATAANEIHMGSLSELGPIDPQINDMPALGLKNSIEHIAELVNKSPGSAEMFARYLGRTVEPIQIGYYERAAKSAEQYAVRLLSEHKDTLARTPDEIANRLVYEYKDHGFVIDKWEAKNIFGEETIKTDTDEYKLGNSIYSELSRVERIANILGFTFYLFGTLDSSPTLVKRSS